MAHTCPRKCCSLKYARFFASIAISVFALAICVVGMAGVFPNVDASYFTNVMYLIIGFWTGVNIKGNVGSDDPSPPDTPYQSLSASDSPSSTPPATPPHIHVDTIEEV
mgnify:FL=1